MMFEYTVYLHEKRCSSDGIGSDAYLLVTCQRVLVQHKQLNWAWELFISMLQRKG